MSVVQRRTGVTFLVTFISRDGFRFQTEAADRHVDSVTHFVLCPVGSTV